MSKQFTPFESEQLKIKARVLGSKVKLHEPYRPSDDPRAKSKEWEGYQYGIVVEVLAFNYRPKLAVRNVSLHLFDTQGNLYLLPCKDRPISTFVDFNVSEFTWLADDMKEVKNDKGEENAI